MPGLIAAFVAAFVWATYSVLSRKLKSVPTDAVAGFCLATALLAALVHGLVEVTVWPETMAQWLAIIALGVGPVGAAFYAWDIGMKRGDIRVLGAASYATPLLSTAFLILAGFAKPSANIAIAAVLIAGGGLIAARIWCGRRALKPPAASPAACTGFPESARARSSCNFSWREAVELLKAHDQRPPFVGVDAIAPRPPS